MINIYQSSLVASDLIFATFNNGNFFFRLYFSDTYLQIPVDSNSKKPSVINKHIGLFQYNRLPFEINTALAIFQQTVPEMISGSSEVVPYLNDILISIPTSIDYLKRLRTVLERVELFGSHFKKKMCFFNKSVK